MKRKLSIVIAVVLCLTTVFSTEAAFAATSWPSLSTSSYCEFTATKDINVYKNTACSVRGTSSPAKSYNAYIAKNDTCYIYKITSSYVELSYPTSSGYKRGYIKRSHLFGLSAPAEKVTSKGKVTTYKTASTSYSHGYVAKGDTVFKVGTSGYYTHIIYQAKSGKRAYKLAYVPTSKYNNGIKSTSSQSTVTSASKKLNVPLYKQNDSRWKNVKIGSKTIGAVGCTTTAIAMTYSYKTGKTVYPNTVKSKLRYSNNDLIWSSLSNVGLTSKAYNSKINNSMMSTIYSKLKANKPVIIGAQTSSGASQHWVVITGYTGTSTSSFSTANFTVNDPGTQNSKTLKAFLANGSKADRTIIKRIIY